MALTLEARRSLLRRFRLFAQAETPLKQRIVAAARPASLQPGEFFFHEGDHCERVALVYSGSIRVYKGHASGREITLYHVEPHNTCLLNVLAVLTRGKFPATARAESETRALLLPADDFRVWLHASEGLRTYVFGAMGDRFTEVITLVEEVAFRRLDVRLAEFLLGQAAHRQSPGASLSTTHEQIAAELGSAREVISRLLHEFQHLGAIRLSRGHIRFRDPALLQAFLADRT